MKTFNSKLVDFFMSNEIHKERVTLDGFGGIFEDDLEKEKILDYISESYREGVFDNFFYIPELKMYCDTYAKKNKLKPYAVLDAHGDYEDGFWNYEDDGESYPVQKWINKNDGKYGSLLIACCNENAEEIPRSKKSIIVFSNGMTTDNRFSHLSEENYNFEAIFPGQKEPLNLYCIEHEIRQLKKRK